MLIALTKRQRRFVNAYLADPNAKKAAAAAGYSVKTAAQQGSRLLKHPAVAAAIAEGQNRVSERTGVTAEMVVAELARIGFARITDLVTWRSNVREWRLEETEEGEDEVAFTITNQVQLVDSDNLPPKLAAAIAEVTRSANGTIKIKMHDKVGALTKLGLHLGVFGRIDKPEAPGKKQAAQAKADEVRGRFAPP